jgi:hypothetical protein
MNIEVRQFDKGVILKTLMNHMMLLRMGDTDGHINGIDLEFVSIKPSLEILENHGLVLH